MPKMKTKRAAAKRFSVTGTGRIKRRKQGLRHILTKKDHKMKKNLGKAGLVHVADEVRVKMLIPYK
ncbi:MAG: 50S ribosomal protein L35 [Bdellovibrionales bacterium RIFOXYB1_FULL_37_110]|nr:MAG: 50S ribosomal protein L35 [Bdellovibrionales bacterium RIFOXYA1_FULL_38_20]OFZ51040.1 MAG: 50S ribosomal protein L35 [Bdellovibrionales bacterium RIFOXYC1_FULL_37_79]OFZ60252.1 MAG: 50S ribosomal protein L35 [Bdellovibrionales bacterium RIFOXYB1_FULL_37_110]OFZ63247.1 MAG: 50S ribosomal protein L35 [Bdellovibrionales bacterium RIFOXYD1_FULL_36_51]OFZ67261.1 MAG: 50S ribosomal protein L35 [Bdellovibrionales bacterium RIFOXYB2_FULL_36_6]